MAHPRLIGVKHLSSFVRPMLASSSKLAVNREGWVAEIKYDGYRAIASTGKEIILSSRNGISYTKSFPRIVKALERIDIPIVLDGEIVVLDKKTGLPDFNALQLYRHNSTSELIFYVFDLLHYQGKDLRTTPLIERKHLLQSLFDCSGTIRYCDHVEGDSIEALFEHVRTLGLEGIICKRKDSTYRDGERSKDWVKIKNYQEGEFFILGHTTDQFALLLGEAVDGKLLYRGEVGTGWTSASRKKIYNLLLKSEGPDQQYLKRLPKINAKWVKPQYMCRVKYLDLTYDGQLRHAVFMKVL